LKAIDHEKYNRKVAEKYEIATKGFEAFAKDYDFYPKGQYGSDEDEAVSESLQKISRDIGLPLNYMQLLQQHKVIDFAPTYQGI
jgi:hypothetical protein